MFTSFPSLYSFDLCVYVNLCPSFLIEFVSDLATSFQISSVLNEVPERMCGSRVWGPFLEIYHHPGVLEFKGEVELVWPMDFGVNLS